MMRFVTAVLAAGLVALATLPDLASGVASSPPECPVCDCSSEAASYLGVGGRSAPVAIPVPEEYEEVVAVRDYPADDGYPKPASYEDYVAVDPYDEYVAAAEAAYPMDLDMGYGDYGLFRGRRSTAGSSYSGRYGGAKDWSDIGKTSKRLLQSSRVLRANDYIRRQFDLYGPPAAIFKGQRNDKYKWPTFKPAYYWKFPAFGSGYGTPYRRYSPVAYSPVIPQYY